MKIALMAFSHFPHTKHTPPKKELFNNNKKVKILWKFDLFVEILKCYKFVLEMALGLITIFTIGLLMSSLVVFKDFHFNILCEDFSTGILLISNLLIQTFFCYLWAMSFDNIVTIPYNKLLYTMD